jgi:hypothetical protein
LTRGARCPSSRRDGLVSGARTGGGPLRADGRRLNDAGFDVRSGNQGTFVRAKTVRKPAGLSTLPAPAPPPPPGRVPGVARSPSASRSRMVAQLLVARAASRSAGHSLIALHSGCARSGTSATDRFELVSTHAALTVRTSRSWQLAATAQQARGHAVPRAWPIRHSCACNCRRLDGGVYREGPRGSSDQCSAIAGARTAGRGERVRCLSWGAGSFSE